MSETIRVRIAPSPTGPIHIGNVHTALFNWLYAKKNGGQFILRFEDTDLARSEKRFESLIFEEMKWLGLTWDEGPDIGGPYGPYRQTERLKLYQQYAQKLLDENHAYHCYCTVEEIEEERKRAEEKGETYRYSGRCRHLTPEEKTRFAAEGRKPAIRFRVPDNEKIVINDMVRGPIEFDTSLMGDFIIVRPNGVPVYNFAVVIDDVTMRITDIIRGEGHISNTPIQILIYRALGLPLPRFAHVSHILSPEGGKFSKREGTGYVGEYRKRGYLPEALFNFLALLGWSPEDGREFLTPNELITEFSLDRVSKNASVFDLNKLNWMNSQYIKQADLGRLTELSIPFLVEAGFITEDEARRRFDWVKQIVSACRERVDYLAQLKEQAAIFFLDEYEIENEEAKQLLLEPEIPAVMNAFLAALENATELTPDSVNGLLKALTKELKLPGKKVYMPIRVALTGAQHGVELIALIPILGKERVTKRVSQTLAKVGVSLSLVGAGS